MNPLAALASALGGLLFPPACPLCSRSQPQSEVCPACQEQVQPPPEPLCPHCGNPGSHPGLCPPCAQSPPAFASARSLAQDRGPLAQALRDFKYRRRWLLGPALGRLAAAWVDRTQLAGADLVAVVPLHRRRLARRGFNQSLVLAGPLAASLGLPLVPRLLRRVRHTPPQVGLDRPARRANVAGAFALGPGGPQAVEGRRVLLWDDVFTSGTAFY